MFTLIKIFLNVGCPSVNEVKAEVKAKQDEKKKNGTEMNLQFEASLLISYRKH